MTVLNLERTLFTRVADSGGDRNPDPSLKKYLMGPSKNNPDPYRYFCLIRIRFVSKYNPDFHPLMTCV